MSKQIWKPGNMLYPVPAVLVSVADSAGNDNLITIAWTGTVCSDPAMTYISVRKERYSHHIARSPNLFAHYFLTFFFVCLFFLIKIIKIMIIFTASSSECLSLKLVQAASFLIQRPAVQPFHLSAVL